MDAWRNGPFVRAVVHVGEVCTGPRGGRQLVVHLSCGHAKSLDFRKGKPPVVPEMAHCHTCRVTKDDPPDVRASITALATVAVEVRRRHPLPRCKHGNALRDHAGDVLAPSCGCEPSAPDAETSPAPSEPATKETP